MQPHRYPQLPHTLRPLLAAENGLPGMANIILVGKLLKETGFAVLDAVRPVLEKMIPPKKANLIDANMKALAIGMAL